ncbi:hypothetical protein PGB90_004037 [Kerria lacca]
MILKWLAKSKEPNVNKDEKSTRKLKKSSFSMSDSSVVKISSSKTTSSLNSNVRHETDDNIDEMSMKRVSHHFNLPEQAAVCDFRSRNGLLYPSFTTLISKWMPPEERGRALGISFGGSYLGPLIGLQLSGFLASSNAGWPSIFYITGGMNCLWSFIWFWIGASSPDEHKFISTNEKNYIKEQSENSLNKDKKNVTPWRQIFKSMPFYAIIISHLGENWGFWTLATQMPNYINSVLGVNIKEATLWGPSLFLFILGVSRSRNVLFVVITLVITIFLNSAAYSGCMVNHVDLSPNYCGTLMGITNSIATISSIIGPLSVGWLVTDTASDLQWAKVFYLSSGIMFVANLFYIIFGSADVQKWDNYYDRTAKIDDPLVTLDCLEQSIAIIGYLFRKSLQSINGFSFPQYKYLKFLNILCLSTFILSKGNINLLLGLVTNRPMPPENFLISTFILECNSRIPVGSVVQQKSLQKFPRSVKRKSRPHQKKNFFKIAAKKPKLNLNVKESDSKHSDSISSGLSILSEICTSLDSNDSEELPVVSEILLNNFVIVHLLYKVKKNEIFKYFLAKVINVDGAKNIKGHDIIFVHSETGISSRRGYFTIQDKGVAVNLLLKE